MTHMILSLIIVWKMTSWKGDNLLTAKIWHRLIKGRNYFSTVSWRIVLMTSSFGLISNAFLFRSKELWRIPIPEPFCIVRAPSKKTRPYFKNYRAIFIVSRYHMQDCRGRDPFEKVSWDLNLEAINFKIFSLIMKFNIFEVFQFH